MLVIHSRAPSGETGMPTTRTLVRVESGPANLSAGQHQSPEPRAQSPEPRAGSQWLHAWAQVSRRVRSLAYAARTRSTMRWAKARSTAPDETRRR